MLDKYELAISEITLVPSSGGRFEVSVDGELVFSKLEQKRFPQESELLDLVGQRIGSR
ncbi:hypothetical protein HRbin27_00249 [bacterium HR27]|nr:hypothetical protein HRbin27_00249 [bacterium HR27]